MPSKMQSINFLFILFLCAHGTEKLSNNLLIYVGRYLGPKDSFKINTSLKKWSKLKVYDNLTPTNKEVVLFKHKETNQLLLEDYNGFIMRELKDTLETVESEISILWQEILVAAFYCILEAKRTIPQYLNSLIDQKSFVETLLEQAMSQNLFKNPEYCFRPFILASTIEGTFVAKILDTMGNEFIDKRIDHKFTALDLSMLYKVYDSCQVLLERGANPNVKDEQGDYLLMHAVYDAEELESLKFVQILLQYGANVSLRNNFGINAIDLANQHSKMKKECILLLEKAQNIQENLRKKQLSKRKKLEKFMLMQRIFPAINYLLDENEQNSENVLKRKRKKRKLKLIISLSQKFKK